MAVKITLSSLHIGPAGLTVIDTLGAEGGVTFIVMILELAVGDVTQISLDVNITLTASPSFKVVEEKVLLLTPTFTPLICH